MTDRLPQRTLNDYRPVLVVSGVVAAIIVAWTVLVFVAGQRSALSPCLGTKLDAILTDSDSIVRGLVKARTR